MGAPSVPGPTGQQHELSWGEHVAVVVEVGGGLRRYRFGGRDVVDGYAADAMPDAARGELLAPWPNRIRDGRYRWNGAEHQLAINEPATRNAIHGLVRRLPFALRARQDAAVTLGTVLEPQPGYSYRLDIEVQYTLGRDGLAVAITARNAGGSDAPYAVGQHPYITVGTDHVDGTVLTLPADRWLRVDDRGTPVSEAAVAGSPYDFRQPRPLGSTVFDTAYTGLTRDPAGRVVARLTNPDDGCTVDLWLGGAADFLQVYTGDAVPDPSRRRRSVAIEPMSAPADAFNSGQGLVRLPPGGMHRLGWGITPRPDPRPGRTLQP